MSAHTPCRRREAGPPRWTGRLIRTLLPVALVASLGAVAAATPNQTAGPGGGGNTVSSGADPNAEALSLGAQWWPYSAGPGQLGAIPQAISVDQVVDDRRTKKMFMMVTRNEDTSNAVLRNTMKVAEDNGLEFTDYDKLPEGFNWASSGRLRDGSIKLVKFVPGPAAAPNKATIPIASSTDLGNSWSVVNSTVREDKWKFDWYRVTHGLMELGDGTLLQPVYAGGSMNGKQGYFIVVLQSSDQGRSWTQRSLMNTDGDSGELAIARTTDGRLLAVTRSNEGSGNQTRPMKQTWSTDDGLTWGPQQTFVPPKGLPSEGILPELTLQANGAMLLSYGRPNNNVAVSWDGTGEKWQDGKVVFDNHIRDTHRGDSMGSSGNTSIVSAESNSSINFGDICHNIWSCREHGQQNGAWANRIDAVTAGKGKLDLATRVREGGVKITGAVVPGDSRYAEQRLAGAVDGSNEYRAAARFPDGADRTVTLELDQTYQLDKIGLMLDRGVPNSAQVEVSLDGEKWTKVVDQVDSTDYAIRQHPIDPTPARWVRVTGVDGKPFTALNELELFAADTWTFDNDAVNATPRGTVDTLHAFTADTVMPGRHSQRRAILVDMDPDTRGVMTFPTKEASGIDLSFGFAGAGYGSGAIWEIPGKDAKGAPAPGWKFLFRAAPGGAGFALSAWDGVAWKDVGTFPEFTPNYQWIDVKLGVDANQAAMTVHGRTLTTGVKAGSAQTFDAFRPSTGLDVADQNMEHSYDEVRIAALDNWTLSGPDPATLNAFPGKPASTTMTVHNFSSRRVMLPVRASAPAGYRVEAPRTVQVPAGEHADVPVTVTRTTAGEQPATLVLRVGDKSVEAVITPQSDLVRIATMSASSTAPASSVNNLNSGNTDPSVWGSGGKGGWNDLTSGAWPDWVAATWREPVDLSKVVVHTVSGAANPAEKWGVRDYDVQAQVGDEWKTVAEVRGSTQGVNTSTFPTTRATALRVQITDSNDHTYSRLIAVQAY